MFKFIYLLNALLILQVYPSPRGAAFISQLAIQRIAHLPHHGVPPLLLRSLPSVGELELLPIDLFVMAARALASARLATVASAMLERLQKAAASSELRPLSSLSTSGGLRAGFVYQPGDGAAIASHVVEAHGLLVRAREFTAPRRKGRVLTTAEVARFLEPHISAAALGKLICDRIRLWLPRRLVPSALAPLVVEFLGVLINSSAPERWSTLKFVCNAWTLDHRFGGSTPPCPACGLLLGSRLQHLVSCRAFWAPVLTSRPELASASFAALALSGHSPKSLHRAFVALASPSCAAWRLRVRAVM